MSIQSPKPLPRHRREKMSAAASTEHGVAAPDVARRCERVADASAKALIWWLQAASYRTGGLKAVAQQLVADNPNACLSKELATASPDQLGQRVRPSVEGRLRLGCGADYDLLGALSDSDADLDTDPAYWPTLGKLIADIRLETVGRLTEYLLDLCLNPRRELVNDEPEYFGGLRSALARLVEGRSAALRPALVQTDVACRVTEAFGYALRTRSFVIVNGRARIGKTCSGRAWCDQHPGVARYVQVPPARDEFSFFRAIAEALGVPFTLSAKVVELRWGIEEVLQRGNLLLCLDEAHHLWPQSTTVSALPGRISWLMTAVLNYGVPVVALTTPQFFDHLKRIEDRSFWASHQLTGRIGKFVQLPDEVPEKDLVAVARHMLPELTERDLKALVAVAISTQRYLAAIDAAVKAARDFATLAGRDRVISADVVRAIGESVLPSDTALAAVLKRRTAPSKRLRSVPASQVPATGLADAEPLQPRAVRPTGFDLPTPSAPQRGGILAEA